MKKLLLFPIIAFALLVFSSANASAAVIYNSIPSPLAGSYPSVGFQATQTAEFGDHITFAGTERILTSVDVVMNSWACQQGGWNTHDCANPDASNTGYTHPLTLTIYNVDTSGAVPVIGSVVTTVTQNTLVPWRPASDPSCTSGGYLPDCNNGYNFTVSFTIPDVVVPDHIVYGISFNTQSWGANPIGVDGPYNSLNMSVPNTTPSVGTNVNPDDVFWNTQTAVNYTDGGVSGVGIFRQDTGWSTYVPAARFNAKAPITTATVHIFKYIDGSQATTDPASANGVSFPMFTSTYNAPFTLGPGGHTTGDIDYEASTSPIAVGSSYSAEEKLDTPLVGASCDGTHTYALVGYGVGDTLQDAQQATVTTEIPSLTNLQSDKYIIVQNHKCPTTGSISGMKYNDLNHNGKKDAGEPGLAGWTIRLKTNSSVVTAVTDVNGNYSFTDLTPGTYILREIHQMNWKRMSKNPKPIVLIAGANVIDVNFGNAKIRRGERADDSKDDDRNDESGQYYSGHYGNNYDHDSNDRDHKSNQNNDHNNKGNNNYHRNN
jgi:hypothetical protein